MSPSPDLGLCQLADRRGLFDAEFADLLSAQCQAGAERADMIRADLARL